MNPRKITPYIRLLELQAIINEEWGELVKELNNYLWKGNKAEHLDRSLEELNDLVSPLLELEALLKVTKQKIEQNKKAGQ